MEKKIVMVVLLLVMPMLMACQLAVLSLSSNFTDESALVALRAHITSDPNNILASNWSQGTSFCNWIGVSCSNRRQRVTALNLPNMGIRGTIPKEIGNLSFLISLDFSVNNFHGNLPHELGLLHRLKSLDLSFNGLSGVIPTGLGFLTKLQVMSLSDNHLTGSLPREISFLPTLQRLAISNNYISSFIPSTIFNISSLRVLALRNNSLYGTLPMDMCNNLPKLEELRLSYNQLSGELPNSLSKCTEFRYMSLAENRFTGSIPRGIGNLSKLEELHLANNRMTGIMESEIWNLSALKLLRLGRNNMTGKIPPSVGNMSTLEVIDISENNIHGNIPHEMGQLLNLTLLGGDTNNLAGEIPESIFNISTLQFISLAINQLSGNLPSSIGLGHPNLEELLIAGNKYGGTIPCSISNASKLTKIDLGYNLFNGRVPTTFGNLRYLQYLSLDSNNLTDDQSRPEIDFLSSLTDCKLLKVVSIVGNPLNDILPKSWGNLSISLEQFYAGSSRMRGMIPSEIGNLSNLVLLGLGDNDLIGSIPNTLGQLRNIQRLQIDETLIQGLIPNSFCNLTNIGDLFLGRNKLSGPIPSCLGQLTSLRSLDLRSNALTSKIPPALWSLEDVNFPNTLGQLRNIQRLQIDETLIQGLIPNSFCNLTNIGDLFLGRNKLSGPIPSCLGQLTSLRSLDLRSNALTSKIPPALWSLEDVNFLNLYSNLLTGSLPPEIGNLKRIRKLYLSENQFTGEIPSTIGQLQNLESLNLSQNRLQGPIPLSFSDLISLTSLDLSQNDLSGVIPKSLEKLLDLKYLNVSFNRLTGEIPTGGPFANFSAESFNHNDALCGAPQFRVKACKNHRKSRKIQIVLKFIIPPVVASVCVGIALLIWWLRYQNKKRHIPVQVDLPISIAHRRISYHEILCATNHFSEGNLIGKGSIGTVYKGTFSDGLIAAVKVFDLELQRAFKTFDAECEVLRNIRHRNLVKIISSCSNLDFKALVLEYMPNWNLENWLYSYNYSLNIVERLGIMIDVASALEYLHHGYSTPVVHCDLKPSNILLDKDMVAHVADFGIAKLLAENKSITHTQTLGTIGYMAPEYGSAGIVSVAGDVYSYGILLMETFTSKKPTYDLFLGEVSLKSWVSDSFPSAVMDVLDANLVRGAQKNFTIIQMCLTSVLKLALECSSDLPEERINITNALVRLKKIKTIVLEN